MEEKKILGVPEKCMMKIVVAIAVLFALFLVMKVIKDIKLYSYIGNDYARNTISVNGKGEKIVKPDIANVSFSVIEEDLDVSKAQNAMNKKMAEIIKVLKDSGVEEKDIKTSSYNIAPRYEYYGSKAYSYDGVRYIAGYEVSQGVSLKIRDMEKAGKIISSLGEFGVSNMSGLSFSVDKYDDLVKEAREEAIKEAREEAERLADQLGVRLGDIISYYDSSMDYPVYYERSMTSAYGKEGDSVAPAVLPEGENTITSNVNITYEIK